jgi:glycosyltransferase involved in cell wall biosynthesis
MWRDTIAWLRPQLDALGDKVQVRGFLSPVDLAQHLAAADLCVFPSLWDNFPSACLEAMSAARPIVATRSGGMEDMLGNGEAGLLVPCGDARALADAICRLIADPLLRLQLATRARERLTANYTPAVLGPRYDALYAEVKERRR